MTDLVRPELTFGIRPSTNKCALKGEVSGFFTDSKKDMKTMIGVLTLLIKLPLVRPMWGRRDSPIVHMQLSTLFRLETQIRQESFGCSHIQKSLRTPQEPIKLAISGDSTMGLTKSLSVRNCGFLLQTKLS